MNKVVVLSAGNMAAEAIKLLHQDVPNLDITIADIDKTKADEIAQKVNGTGAQFDATDPKSIANVIRGADLVLNAVGPFYRYGLGIIKVAIENKVNYIDICDEHDVTVALVEDEELNKQAEQAGIFAIYGMGFSPGVSNLAAKWASDLLDETEKIEIATAIPYFPNLGTTINDHMLHSMSGEVPQFINGQIEYHPAWGGEKRFLFENHEPMHIGFMGHPEGVTLGKSIPGIQEATIRFRWLEDEGNDIWKTFVRFGLSEQMEDDHIPMAPRQYLARYMDTEAGMKHLSLSEESNAQYNVFHAAATGKRDGKNAKVVVEYHSENDQGDPTPIAMAYAMKRALEGRVEARGLVPPEQAIVDPQEFVEHVVKNVNGKIYVKEEMTELIE